MWRASGAEGDGDGLGILAQVFDADGVVQCSGRGENTTTAGNQTDQSVAMDADGDFVVAWESGEIMAQRFDRSGAKIGGKITVNTYTDLNQKNPSVGSDAAGNFTVVWESGGGADPTGTGHNGGIFGRQVGLMLVRWVGSFGWMLPLGRSSFCSRASHERRRGFCRHLVSGPVA